MSGTDTRPDPPPTSGRRELIEATISDAVIDFVYYRRKEDEDLPLGAIEAAIAAGEITVEQIISAFASELRTALSPD